MKTAFHGLIAGYPFNFISAPVFGDFVVANGYHCSGNNSADLRSVPTSDDPERGVKYCTRRRGGGG